TVRRYAIPSWMKSHTRMLIETIPVSFQPFASRVMPGWNNSGRRPGQGVQSMIRLNINGKDYEVDVENDTPLLWAIRENAGLTGTKYGCGIAQCGACTVHVDGEAVRSCGMQASDAVGKKITTVEGLAV